MNNQGNSSYLITKVRHENLRQLKSSTPMAMTVVVYQLKNSTPSMAMSVAAS